MEEASPTMNGVINLDHASADGQGNSLGSTNTRNFDVITGFSHIGAMDDITSTSNQVPAKLQNQVPANGSSVFSNDLLDGISDDKFSPKIDSFMEESTGCCKLTNGHTEIREEPLVCTSGAETNNETTAANNVDNGKSFVASLIKSDELIVASSNDQEEQEEKVVEENMDVETDEGIACDSQQFMPVGQRLEPCHIRNRSLDIGDDQSDDSLYDHTADQRGGSGSEDMQSSIPDFRLLHMKEEEQAVDSFDEPERDTDSDKSVAGSCDSLEQPRLDDVDVEENEGHEEMSAGENDDIMTRSMYKDEFYLSEKDKMKAHLTETQVDTDSLESQDVGIVVEQPKMPLDFSQCVISNNIDADEVHVAEDSLSRTEEASEIVKQGKLEQDLFENVTSMDQSFYIETPHTDDAGEDPDDAGAPVRDQTGSEVPEQFVTNPDFEPPTADAVDENVVSQSSVNIVENEIIDRIECIEQFATDLSDTSKILMDAVVNENSDILKQGIEIYADIEHQESTAIHDEKDEFHSQTPVSFDEEQISEDVRDAWVNTEQKESGRELGPLEDDQIDGELAAKDVDLLGDETTEQEEEAAATEQEQPEGDEAQQNAEENDVIQAEHSEDLRSQEAAHEDDQRSQETGAVTESSAPSEAVDVIEQKEEKPEDEEGGEEVDEKIGMEESALEETVLEEPVLEDLVLEKPVSEEPDIEIPTVKAHSPVEKPEDAAIDEKPTSTEDSPENEVEEALSTFDKLAFETEDKPLVFKATTPKSEGKFFPSTDIILESEEKTSSPELDKSSPKQSVANLELEEAGVIVESKELPSPSEEPKQVEEIVAEKVEIDEIFSAPANETKAEQQIELESIGDVQQRVGTPEESTPKSNINGDLIEQQLASLLEQQIADEVKVESKVMKQPPKPESPSKKKKPESPTKKINGEAKTIAPFTTAKPINKRPTTLQRVKRKDKKEAENDSGVDENTQAKADSSPKKPALLFDGVRKKPVQQVTSPTKFKRLPTSPTKSLASPTKAMASAKSPMGSGGALNSKGTPGADKKLPMNKVVVGLTPSPNIREVKSKIGSMQNIKHRPGGGKVKMETKHTDYTQAKSKIGSVDNMTHKPGGGEKRITNQKLEWKAASKIGSLDNAAHKPGGGNKKIDVVKVDFSDAKSKVGSKDNIQHVPGGGQKKIETQSVDFTSKVESKVGSLDNVKHVPGGGIKEIFDDKSYLKGRSPSKSLSNSDGHLSGPQTPESLSPIPPCERQTPSSEDAMVPGNCTPNYMSTEAEQ